MITTLANCARCGGTHSVEVNAFTKPASTGTYPPFTHWAMCPTNNEPILFSQVASKVEVPAPKSLDDLPLPIKPSDWALSLDTAAPAIAAPAIEKCGEVCKINKSVICHLFKGHSGPHQDAKNEFQEEVGGTILRVHRRPS